MEEIPRAFPKSLDKKRPDEHVDPTEPIVRFYLRSSKDVQLELIWTSHFL